MDDAPETARATAPASGGRASGDNGHVIGVAAMATTFSAEQTGPGFGPGHLAMLLVLAQRQGRNEHTWASQDDLARCARMGKRAAVDILVELVAFGWVGRRGPVKSDRGIELHHWLTLPGRPIPVRGKADSATPLPSTRGGTAEPATGARQILHDGYGRFCKRGTADSADKKNTEKTTEKNTEKTTRLDAPRPGVAGAQTNLFGEVKSDGEPTPKKATTKKPVGDSARRYGDAFVAGMADAGRTVSPPPASECRVLGSVLATHGKGDGGAALTGEAAETWIRETTAAYARACPDPGKRAGGSRPWGLRAWLDDGRPSQATAARGSAYAAPVVRAQPGTWASSGPGESYEELLTA